MTPAKWAAAATINHRSAAARFARYALIQSLTGCASVVIYTIDPRGLPPLNLSAADNTTGITNLENGAVVRANGGAALMQ
ncbi:MAG TPA: hypothetical protein VIU65_11965, partial [Pyrinomonadaceae bacterium]